MSVYMGLCVLGWPVCVCVSTCMKICLSVHTFIMCMHLCYTDLYTVICTRSTRTLKSTQTLTCRHTHISLVVIAGLQWVWDSIEKI